MIRDVHPGSGYWFFTHPGSRGQKGTGSRISKTGWEGWVFSLPRQTAYCNQDCHRASWVMEKRTALGNRNYFLRFRFRFRLLKNYRSGSGSDFWEVMVPVPSFKKLRFRFRFWFQLHIETIKSKFVKKIFGYFLLFYIVSCFTRKKFINFNKFIVKCEWKKC